MHNYLLRVMLVVQPVLWGCRPQSSSHDFPLDRTWQRVARSENPGGDAPLASQGGAAVYDGQRGRVMLFGGRDEQHNESNQLWEFDLGRRQWMEVQTEGLLSPPRFGHSLVLDSVNDSLVLFGGADPAPTAETWTFDLRANSWSNTTHNSAPSCANHTAIYDPRAKRMIVFGGKMVRDAASQARPTNEAFALNLDPQAAGFRTWELLRTSVEKPQPRRRHSAVYDSIRHRLLICGGSGPVSRWYFNDLWALDLSSLRWSEVSTQGELPHPFCNAVAALDRQTDKLIVFGGSVSVTIEPGNTEQFLVNRVWVLDLKSLCWTDRTPHPRTVYDHSMVFIPDRDAAITYGGSSHRPVKEHDTWLLQSRSEIASPYVPMKITGNAGTGDAHVETDQFLDGQ